MRAPFRCIPHDCRIARETLSVFFDVDTKSVASAFAISCVTIGTPMQIAGIVFSQEIGSYKWSGTRVATVFVRMAVPPIGCADCACLGIQAIDRQKRFVFWWNCQLGASRFCATCNLDRPSGVTALACVTAPCRRSLNSERTLPPGQQLGSSSGQLKAQSQPPSGGKLQFFIKFTGILILGQFPRIVDCHCRDSYIQNMQNPTRHNLNRAQEE